MNPWLDIPLEDYEAHMSLASVGQASYLAEVLRRRVEEIRPRSLALIGCAGGNGLEGIDPGVVEHVIGIDVNPHFIAATRTRFGTRYNRMELICDDFMRLANGSVAVDFVFAGLVFEYVDYKEALKRAVHFIRPEGSMSVVLQLPCETQPAVTPSPYVSLNKLEELFSFVPLQEFRSLAESAHLVLRKSETTTLVSGKSFHEFLFQRM